jgi:hypothetical protein
MQIDLHRFAITLGFLALAACGSSNGPCDQACSKIEMCSPGTTCTVNGNNCTGAALTFANCVNSSSCQNLGMCLVTGLPDGGTSMDAM